jgi:hypothetical protein
VLADSVTNPLLLEEDLQEQKIAVGALSHNPCFAQACSSASSLIGTLNREGAGGDGARSAFLAS